MPGVVTLLPTKILAENDLNEDTCTQILEWYKLLIFILSGYVDTLKKLLFTLPKSEMKKALDKYSAKVPKPLKKKLLRDTKQERKLQKHPSFHLVSLFS